MHRTLMIPDATWRKCDVAAAASMGGASISAFIRRAVERALADVASQDLALAGAFQVIDESEGYEVAA